MQLTKNTKLTKHFFPAASRVAIVTDRIKSCFGGKFDQKYHDQLRFSNRDDRGRNRDSVNVP